MPMNELVLSVGATVIAGSALAGCDSGAKDSGPPKNIDMNKSYSPPVQVGPITPQDQKKAIAKSKEAAKADTPAEK